jgi:hypothetical protein
VVAASVPRAETWRRKSRLVNWEPAFVPRISGRRLDPAGEGGRLDHGDASCAQRRYTLPPVTSRAQQSMMARRQTNQASSADASSALCVNKLGTTRRVRASTRS